MIILDGGMGRQLKRMGAPFRQPEWSALALMEAPDLVRQAHQAFIDAGSNVITTNSYAAVPYHIGGDTFAERGAELINLSGQLARQAATNTTRPIQVAGGLPPVCGSYQPDDYKEQEARALLEIFKSNLSAYCDFWLAETQSSIAEVKTIIDMFGDDNKQLWVSVTLEDSKPIDGRPLLRSGEPLETLFDLGLTKHMSALLFNCSQPEVMLEAVSCAVSLRSHSDLGIGVYANAFPPVVAVESEANSTLSKIRADLTPKAYAKFCQQWRSAGADRIGGCCGIGPEHIYELSKLPI